MDLVTEHKILLPIFMSNTGKYSLLFTGLKDEDPTTLRKVKTVFVTDLDLPIPEIQEILDNPPRCILSADQRNDLKALLKSLKAAGALVEVVENSVFEKDQTEPEGEEDSFSFEIDLSELSGTKKAKNTRVWELSFDHDDEDEPSLADLIPKRPPSPPPAVSESLEAGADESTDEILLEPLGTAPEEQPPPASDKPLTPPAEAIPALLERDSTSKANSELENNSLSPYTDTVTEDELSLETTDSELVEPSPEPKSPQEKIDPLDIMLLSLDDEDHEEETPLADSYSPPNYDLQIPENPEEDADDDEAPSEDELDLLLIDIDDEQQDEGYSASSFSVAQDLSTKDETLETETPAPQALANEFDLAFDESDSEQRRETSSPPTKNQPEPENLPNFATSIDDLIPQLESQKESFIAANHVTDLPVEDDSDLSLGDMTTDDVHVVITETPATEQEVPSSEQEALDNEEKAPKQKAKPSFISTNRPKDAPPLESAGLTLNNESSVDDDDEGPTVAHLSTQAKLSRQAEKRRNALRDSILYGVICLAVFIGGNWIFFSFVLNNEDSGLVIQPVTDADIKKVVIEETKDPATPLNPDLALIKETVSKELILQSKSPTFSLRATCGASDKGLVKCKISGEGVESEIPSKKDRANGIKQPPWLSRLESDEIIFNLVKKDDSRVAEGTANAYIMYDRLSSRITANVTLRTSPPPPENTLKKETRKLSVEIHVQKDIPANEGLEVSLTEDKQFALAAKASFDF
jgi:hypothetical protein